MPHVLTGCIQVSSSTWALLQGEPLVGEMLEHSGGINVKGKGMMDTYLWAPPPRHRISAAVAGAPGWAHTRPSTHRPHPRTSAKSLQLPELAAPESRTGWHVKTIQQARQLT